MNSTIDIVAVALLCPLAIGGGVNAQGDPFYEIGHLNTLERQSQFWEETTQTDYTQGTCGYAIVPQDDGSGFDVLASIAGSEPEVWVVGTFTLFVQMPLEQPNEPSVLSEMTSAGQMLLLDDLDRTVIAGHVTFTSGLDTDVTAVVITSGETELVTDRYWAGDNVFIPIRLHETAIGATTDAMVTSSAETGLSVAPPDEDLSQEQRELTDPENPPDDEIHPEDCPWTWCHRPDQFCQDIAQCVADRDAELANARGIRAACLAASAAGYFECMELAGCWQNGAIVDGMWCAAADVGCSAARSIAEAVCRATYLGLTTAAEWNFQACGANAKKNNGKAVPGCDCPDGWEPFPTQAPPSWGHVDCSDVFGVWGLTWSYDLIFD